MEGKKTIERIRLGDIIKDCFDDEILVMEINKYIIRGLYIDNYFLSRCNIPRVMLGSYEKVENIFDRGKNNED